MKWHWSLGNKPGAEKQFQKDLKELGATIYDANLCQHHIQGLQEKIKYSCFTLMPRNTRCLYNFAFSAKPGDEIYLYCKGKLRAKGIFTGEIMPITRQQPSCSSGWKAMVESWEEFSEPRLGLGFTYPRIYEINPTRHTPPCFPNSNNYH